MTDRARPLTSDQTVDASAPEDPHGPTRRTVLRAAGLAALAGGGAAALAACSSDAGVAAPAASSAAAPSADASSSAPSTSASSSASASSSTAAASGPSVAAAEVPVGGGVILKDSNYVITQPTKGKFKAFSKICTHMGCPVAEVDKTINCKCHGSKFSIEDGSVVNPPASKPLAESPVTVSGDKVVVSA
jgi:Rieske Fe-S protein